MFTAKTKIQHPPPIEKFDFLFGSHARIFSIVPFVPIFVKFFQKIWETLYIKGFAHFLLSNSYLTLPYHNLSIVKHLKSKLPSLQNLNKVNL
jgi:hypothetical protein